MTVVQNTAHRPGFHRQLFEDSRCKKENIQTQLDPLQKPTGAVMAEIGPISETCSENLIRWTMSKQCHALHVHVKRLSKDQD
jgi:hypothetical protein